MCPMRGYRLVNRIAVRECAHCRSRERYWYAKRQGKPLPEILPARTSPPPQTWTRRPLPGMKPEQLRAVSLEPAPGLNCDRVLPGRSERPCSACGSMFRVTARRSRLCWHCWTYGDNGPMAA